MERVHKSGVTISQRYLSVKSVKFQAIRRKTSSISEPQKQRWQARSEVQTLKKKGTAAASTERKQELQSKTQTTVETSNKCPIAWRCLYASTPCHKCPLRSLCKFVVVTIWLKQSPRNWNIHWHEFVLYLSIKLRHSLLDHCMTMLHKKYRIKYSRCIYSDIDGTSALYKFLYTLDIKI